MPEYNFSVRELEQKDIEPFSNYWLNATPDFLQKMGVDSKKIPNKSAWKAILLEQLSQPVPEKKSYTLIWELNQQPVGHSNINKIIFGQEAFMHLHLWDSAIRQKGMGSRFVRLGLPYFFEKLRLMTLFCEPNANNVAPNKTLERVGFIFVKKYRTIPGWLNVEQDVNLWEMPYEHFTNL